MDPYRTDLLNRCLAHVDEVFISPARGIPCLITKDGIMRLDGGGSIPWGDIKITDMEYILRNQEGDLDKGIPVTEEWALEDIKRRAAQNDSALDIAVNFFRGKFLKDPPGFEHIPRFDIPVLQDMPKEPVQEDLPPSVPVDPSPWLEEEVPF